VITAIKRKWTYRNRHHLFLKNFVKKCELGSLVLAGRFLFLIIAWDKVKSDVVLVLGTKKIIEIPGS
jgi:hypothetical protein